MDESNKPKDKNAGHTSMRVSLINKDKLDKILIVKETYDRLIERLIREHYLLQLLKQKLNIK